MPGTVPDNRAIRAGQPQHLCLNNYSACSKSIKWSQQMLRDLPRVSDASVESMISSWDV